MCFCLGTPHLDVPSGGFMHFLRHALFLCSAVLLSAGALAQNATTSLRGTVTDPTGAAIPNATVKLEDPAIGFTTTAKADGRGSYSFVELTPGDYTVTFDAPGFSEYTIKTQLQVSLPATVNAKMTVGSQG